MRFKKTVAFGLMFFLCSIPLADAKRRCQVVLDDANDKFQQAQQQTSRGQYERGHALYLRAAEGYASIVSREDCYSPTVKETAEANLKKCEENIARLENYLDKRQNKDEYELAEKRYQQGKQYARRKEWKRALKAYEDAIALWEQLGADGSQSGEAALKNAETARRAAEAVRYNMGAKKK